MATYWKIVKVCHPISEAMAEADPAEVFRPSVHDLSVLPQIMLVLPLCELQKKKADPSDHRNILKVRLLCHFSTNPCSTNKIFHKQVILTLPINSLSPFLPSFHRLLHFGGWLAQGATIVKYGFRNCFCLSFFIQYHNLPPLFTMHTHINLGLCLI